MVKGNKEKGDGGPSAEEQESILESKRLRELAVSRGLLSRAKANPASPLLPTKTIRKCDGKDIVQRGHRKTKYLFAFPGLVAPIAGGKFGDLTHLDSRNPTFYIDFPQGRLKMFGTIVYPKNKYLTMHFLPGRGDIVCEDCFESIVVFPEAWWIGTKEENPEELQLPMPFSLQQEKHTDFSFTGGAGRYPIPNAPSGVNKVATVKNDPQSPEQQFPVERLQESPSSLDKVVEQEMPLRRSSRKSVEKLSRALPSSSDSWESSDGDSETSNFKRKGSRCRRTNKDALQSISRLSPTGANVDDKGQDNASESTVWTTAQKEVHESTTQERLLVEDLSKSSLKQTTLTSFLTNTEKSQIKASAVEVIEIEESPLKGALGKSGRPRRAAKKSFVEESEDTEPSGEESSSSDSDLPKSVGTRRGRGRGRGKGRGGAATHGGRTGTPRKSVAKRRQPVFEISTSDDCSGS